MGVVFANPQVVVNNIALAIKPNSLSFTEGFGEQIVRAASAGGAQVEQILADNIEDNFSEVKFALDPTESNIANARIWKAQPGQNVVSVTATATEGTVTTTFSRTFQKATITNNYDVPLGADTQIDLEWKSSPAQ
ncbi:MAG: hypothetical protein V3V40_05870 [Nitrosomonadaceae bacterium]